MSITEAFRVTSKSFRDKMVESPASVTELDAGEVAAWEAGASQLVPQMGGAVPVVDPDIAEKLLGLDP